MNEVIKKSVTAGDMPDNTNGVFGPVILNYFGGFAGDPATNTLPPLPIYWSINRDFVLRRTMFYESYWSNAVKIAISKMSSQSWSIASSIPLRAKRAQEMFHAANGGKGWVNFIQKHGRDYFTTDNGAFVEIIRSSSAAGSKILGFMHLDSARCTRTGDPDIPIIYRDRKNQSHELKWFQVFSISDDPDPSETFHGVGFCAASSAYTSIRMLAAMQNFVLDKVTGSKPQSLNFITGITEPQLQAALNAQKEEKKARGAATYGGAVLIPFMQKEGISHVQIDIASLPDGFNRDKELSSALLSYADALGIDIQDLQPLTGQAIGTGAQSQVLHEKESGKGIASWRQDFTHLLNEYILDDATTFYFNERDYRDELSNANVANAAATFVSTIVPVGIITPEQGRQYLVDNKYLPQSFQPVDTTPEVTLRDDEKLDLSAVADQQAPDPASLPPSQRPGGPAALEAPVANQN